MRHNTHFYGKIVSVDKEGIIKIKKDDDSIGHYNFDEIKMIY
jgi:hypothetical protein